MRTLILRRFQQTDDGTFGVFMLPYSNPICLSYELPWHDNKTDISCIPTGRYLCILGLNSKEKEVFHIHKVPDRTDIQIHIANNSDDIKGCIAPGTYFDMVKSTIGSEKKIGVCDSRKAFDKLKNIIGIQSFWLQIE